MEKNEKYIQNESLKMAMDEEGLTQGKLAEKLGVGEMTVGRWVRGERFPRAITRRQLRELFNKSDEELGLIKERYTEQEENQLVPLVVTPTPRNRLKEHWLLITIVSCVVLLGLVGSIVIPMHWHPNSTPSTATSTALGTIITPCAAAPILVDPIDGQTLNSRTVTFTWEAPRNCQPDGYTVRITANYDPEAKPWIVDTGWAPTFYKYTFSTDGTYYWHIRACKPCTPFQPGNWVIRSITIHTSLAS